LRKVPAGQTGTLATVLEDLIAVLSTKESADS
jgi:hypothetical protein